MARPARKSPGKLRTPEFLKSAIQKLKDTAGKLKWQFGGGAKTARELREDFEAAKWRDPPPQEWQKRAAWAAAGRPEDFRIKTLPDKQLLALTAEEYEEASGFTPTGEQMWNLLQFEEREDETGTKESHYMQLVAEWKAFKSAKQTLEQPSETQLMRSWQRAGEPKPYAQRTYRDDEGKMLGIITMRPDELGELAGFKPSEAQKVWAFRETRKMKPLAQFGIWQSEQVAEREREEAQEEALLEELASLRTVKATKGADIPAALRTGGGDALRARRREIEEALRIGVDS